MSICLNSPSYLGGYDGIQSIIPRCIMEQKFITTSCAVGWSCCTKFCPGTLALRSLRLPCVLYYVYRQADQVLLRDPFQIVNALESQESHDFITYDDSKYQNSRLPCFGFMFIRPNARSMKVWKTLVQKMLEKNWKTYAGENEQSLFQNIMKIKQSVSVRFLPSNQFRNGVLFGGNGGKFQTPKNRQNESGLAFVHANWVIGIESKKQMLRYHGWWVNDTLATHMDLRP